MSITAADVGDMIKGAAERVRAGWKPTPKGAYLSTLVTEDQPPLTTGAVDMYLGFYTWLWGNEPPAEQAQRLRERLTRDSQTAWARMDWSIRDAVLVTCALWDQIRERPAVEQEAIRSFLQRRIEPGSYPEVDSRAEPGVTTPSNVEDYMKLQAARHDTVMQVLQTWPGIPH
jgi:hypothetical protein